MSVRVDKKLKIRKIRTIVMILLLFISVFIILLTKTDYFNIKKINVKGNSSIETNDIIKASGLKKGMSILKFNKKTTINNLIKNPYIKNIKIKRKFPDTIQLNIVERKGICFFNHLEKFLLIDTEGIVLEKNTNRKMDLPIITNSNIEVAQLGSKIVTLEDNELEILIELIESSEDINIKNEFIEIDLKDKNNVKITIKSGIKVAFGELNNVKYKLSYINKILEKFKEDNIINGTLHLENLENIYFTTSEI